MPLYEYQCQECAEKLEAIQRFSEEPYTICPQCGGALKKLISSPAIQFKGSGFYITDYAKSGSGGESKSSRKSDSSSKGEASTSASSTSGDSSSTAPAASTSSSSSSSDKS